MHRRTLLHGLAATVVAHTAAARAQVRDFNDAVNKAGRQRMLSQRMGKAWLTLVHKPDHDSARAVLDQSMALFDRQLVELKAFAPNAQIQGTYAQLETAWSAYKLALVGSVPAKTGAETLLAADARVLALAHQGTVQYEAAAGKPVAALVNIAGRQRMLSQRMAKFYLAALLPAQQQVATAEIAKARTEFLAALEQLRTAPQATDRIRETLQLAQGQWVFFDAALQRLQPGAQSARQIAEVFTASENLLTSLDRVTGLYAAQTA
ncbi:MAG: type IV pili methyl-accepting chemotaxis transducer N-terminal domain-containing protein [Burkholderiaceae bacterium]